MVLMVLVDLGGLEVRSEATDLEYLVLLEVRSEATDLEVRSEAADLEGLVDPG